MAPRRVGVLGGGVSGLAAAWRLVASGAEVDLLEAAPAVGGLAGTLQDGPYRMDVGPHSFFSDDAAVRAAVLGLFDGELESRPRTVKFLFEGKYIDYPLTPRGVLFQMGLPSGVRAAFSLLRGKLSRPAGTPVGEEDETVEEWAIRSFGEHLYRTFFKPYTEQFWKIPCRELSSRSIPTSTRMSFANTLRFLLHRRRGRRGESLIEREMLPTYYPADGFGEIPARMAEAVRHGGGRVRTGCRAVAVQARPGSGMSVVWNSQEGQGRIECDHVVSTVPLPRLVAMLDPQPPRAVTDAAGRLEFRALIVLGMLTHRQGVLGCGYTYVLNRPYNRIFEMNEFSEATSPRGENIVGVEIPCLRGSAVWGMAKEELFDICSGSLAEDGFLMPGDVRELFLVRAASAYPIYRRDYAGHLQRVLGHIDSISGLTTLGRCGEFRYMDIDECVARAIDLVDRVLGPAGA